MRWILMTLIAAPAYADDARILEAVAEASGDAFRVSVTLEHEDTGWDDYADGWRVVNEAGEVIGTRELLHPHVNEQPFTRSLGGVALQSDGTYFVEAKTSIDGWGEERFPLTVE